MNYIYTITGMTCGGCAAKVKSVFLKHPEVLSAEVSHQDGKAKVQAESNPDRKQLDKLLAEAGEYRITAVSEDSTSTKTNQTHASALPEQESASTWETYKPLVLIFLFVAGIAAIASFDAQTFSWHQWMRYFMAGFFIVFAFFKFLDLKGFARSYAMYDLLAKQWKGYGYVYPFLELGLGVLYLTAINLPATHVATIVIMGFSSIGVIRNMLSPNQVQCACLGTVFKLPLGNVTLVEDLLMVVMAGVMLIM
ncbi:MAG: heavy-metal-associated domain-containing protein [Bacteroidetes bacterium]|nr:MAG: heavy-metal-associated domain-containing protein [Bacteroidota bacterium]